MSKNPEKKRLTNRSQRWAGSEEEELYLPDARKEHKQQRKIASKTDRSKFKKTDLDRRLAKLSESKKLSEKAKRGRILSITAQGMFVSCENKMIVCSLRGTLKQDKERQKNLVTVGDFVWFEEITPADENNLAEGIILQIEKRKTVLSRADHQFKRSQQLIAANVDCVIITVAVVEPPLKPNLVDRYLIAAEKGEMNAIIIVNKIDLLDDPQCPTEEKELFEKFIKDYSHLGYPLLPVSTKNYQGIEELKKLMIEKTCVFSGQSGTGKTSLINAVTGLSMKTSGMINKTKKGTHTTTTTQLIPLKDGGFCVDTPGIRSFGVWQLIKGEVVGYFPELMEWGKNCKYNTCTHTHEPDCAVIKAVEEGKISVLRYESYLKLLDEET